MANQITIDIGAAANDGTGDPLRTAFNYVNNNFSNVWNTGLPNSNVQFSDNRILTVNTNANLVLAPNGIGIVQSNVDIIPSINRGQSLGSSTKKWNSVNSYYINADVANVGSFGNLTVAVANLHILGGSNGYVLQTDGTGNLTWTAQTGGSGNGTPGGANTQVQYNNAGSFGGSASFTFDRTSNVLAVSGNITAGNILVSNLTTTDEIYAATGSLAGDPNTGDGALYVGSPSFTSLGTDVMAQFTGNVTNYGQINFQNYSNSPTASGDYIATADNGNDTTHYIDMGITSSTWNGTQTNVLTGLAPNNGYLYVQDGNLTLGTRNSNTSYSWNFDTTGNLTVPKDIIPTANNTQNLGSASRQWNDLYLSNATIYMNSVPISLTAGNVLTVNGANVVTTTANGVTSLGNIGFIGDAIYDLNGMIIENADLSHGATAAVILPANGDANAIQVNNTYGNIILQTGAGSGITASWSFDNTGNLNLPSNGDINFNNGGITSGLNQDFYITGSDDEVDGWGIRTVMNDGAGANLTQTSVEYNGFYINTDVSGNNYSWGFRDSGDLEVPGAIAGAVGGNLTVKIVDQAGSDTFIDLQTRSHTGDALISNIRIANPDVTISTASAAHNWTFDNAGNLTVPGNIQSISTGFPFSSGIIGIDNTSPAVITVADSTFPSTVTGRVTISGVNPPLQANGTWYYEAVEANQFALYLDAELTQPVDATGWPGYVDGGSAVSPGYSNLAITGGNVSIVTNTGETWTFEAGGALRIPNDITSIGTMDLDNRASGNTADIRLWAADAIQLQGGDKPDDLEAEGGDVNIYAGRGAAALTSGFGTGGGGDIQIFGGIGGAGEATGTSGSSGGFVTIRGGNGGTSLDSTVGGGGSVSITAGSAPSPDSEDPTQGGLGGGVNITAGDTTQINENGGSIEITTGGTSGDGTGAAGYVAINIASSNVGPGGNWYFTGTGRALEVPADSSIYGPNFGNLTVGCAGNTIVTSSDYGSNVQNWVFGYTGNLTLPQGGVVYETNIPFGGLEGKTIALKPSGGTNADQQLLVYPTAGTDFNHLHLTTGNLWNTEMFLGNDDFYVKLANTGNIVINTNDSVGNTAQWTFDYNSTISTNNDLTLQVSDGIPTSTANINSQGGYNTGSYTGLSTTGGSGTGLTVNASTAGNGYIDTVTINAPGSGYTNGDTITIVGGDGLGCTFTIGVPTPAWTFATDGSLTLPTIDLGTDLDEQTVISSQRKLIPPFRWSAIIDGATPTVVYTATDVNTTSMKVTVQIQHTGLGMEFFEVFATFTGSDTFYTVNNRVSPPTIEPSTVVVGLTGTPAMKITVTINSGAGTSWVTYDAVEFGIPND